MDAFGNEEQSQPLPPFEPPAPGYEQQQQQPIPPPPPYGGAYGGAYPYSSTVYGAGYGGGYGAGYGAGYGGMGAYGGMNTMMGGGYGMRRGVAAVAGVQDAMARFARVSAAVDDALRSLHLLFDALFGIGMAFGSLAGEMRVLIRLKSGPAAFLGRMLRRIARIWRFLMVAVMSPIDTPLALLLRILGLAAPPDTVPRVSIESFDSNNNISNMEEQLTAAHNADNATAFDAAFDASHL